MFLRELWRYVPKGRLTCESIGFSRLVRLNTGIFLRAGVICVLTIFVWSVKNQEMSELTPEQICQNRPPRSRNVRINTGMSDLTPVTVLKIFKHSQGKSL